MCHCHITDYVFEICCWNYNAEYPCLFNLEINKAMARNNPGIRLMTDRDVLIQFDELNVALNKITR